MWQTLNVSTANLYMICCRTISTKMQELTMDQIARPDIAGLDNHAPK